MSQKFLLLYINDNILVKRVLTDKTLGQEEIYETNDALDLSARKRRDILVHHISSRNEDDIRYIMTVSTVKPKETITGSETAAQFVKNLFENEKSRIDFFNNMVVVMTNEHSSGKFDITS